MIRRNSLKHFNKSNKGSVSIYFIIVLSAVFMFNAVLIDFIRIKAAEKQTENAMRAALRSTLSQFDSSLQTYGLYALSDPNKGEGLFAEILVRNVLAGTEDDDFRLIQPYWDQEAIQLKFHYSLADHEVFKQQVYEEMKYIAPIEFMLELLNKFQKSGTMSELKEASSFTKTAEQLENLIIRRENSLDHAWSEAEHLLGPQGEIDRLHQKYQQILIELNELAHEINQLTGEIELFDIELPDKELSETTGKELLEKTARFAALVLSTNVSVQQDYNYLNSIRERISGHINQAKDYNEQLKNKIAKTSDSNPIESGSLQETAHDANENILIRELSYFVQYEVGIANVIGLFSGFHLQYDPLELVTGETYVEKYDRLVTANHSYYQQANEFYPKQRRLENERKSRNENLNNLKKDQINRIEQLLKQVRDLFSDCGVNNSNAYNQLISADEIKNSVDLDNAENIGKQSMGLVDQLSVGLLHIRDRAYINEYALSKFSYRTHPNEQTLHNQEAEYILYGLDSCVKNHGAAFAEMFALRLATRTMEALKKPGGSMIRAGSPLLLLLWAVAEGAVKAYEDMKQLVDGKEVELTAKLSGLVTINYKDYLRAFLLMHSSEENVVARMQGLIQLNTGADLQHKATYIEGSAVSYIRLWFIPGIMKWMDQDVEGREAKISKNMVLSY